MKRWMKWMLGIIGCLIFLLVTILIIVITLVNPNDYKGKIEANVYEKTGLYLKINGDIKWQLFPDIGLFVSSINLKNQEKQPLATLKKAQVGIKVLPLLSKKIELGKIVVTGVNLNITKLNNGQLNWQKALSFPAKKQLASDKIASPTAKQIATASQNKPPSAMALNAEKIELKNVNVHYLDQKTNQLITINHAYATTGNILSGKNFPLEAGFTIKSKTPSLNMKFMLTGNGLVSLKDKTYAIKKMHLTVFPQQKTATGDKFTAKGNFSVVKNKIIFDLNGSPLHLSNYLPVKSSTNAVQTGKNASYKSKATAVSASSADKISLHKDKVIIPVLLLRSLNIDGRIKLNELSYNKVMLNQPLLVVKAKDGIAELSELKAGFYNGKIDGKAIINSRDVQPKVSVNMNISDTDINKLSHSLAGIDNIAGHLNASMRLLTHGSRQSALTENLSGLISLTVDKGRITGMNMNHLVCQMISRIRKKNIEKNNWDNFTQFTALKSQWTIENGIARNSDLTASLSQMNLRGDGWINLVSNVMDYHLGLTVTGNSVESDEPACEINQQYSNLTWPVRCQGYWRKKGLCGIDQERLANTAKTLLKNEAQHQLEKQLKKHLGNDITNKLRGLLN